MKKIIMVVSILLTSNWLYATSLNYGTNTGQLVGYIDGTSVDPRTLIQQAASLNYQTIVVGFAAIGDYKTKTRSTDVNWFPLLSSDTAVKQAIAAAKTVQPDLKVLVSIGGSKDYNTFLPADVSGKKVVTTAQTIANNIYAKLHTAAGFDGVDFDLEVGFNATLVGDIIKDLKQQDPDFLVSIAPQLWSKTANSKSNYLVSTADDTSFQDLLYVEKAPLDYVFVQAYNTPQVVAFNASGVPCNYAAGSTSCYDENSAALVPAAFTAVKTELQSAGYSTTPKIFIGEPAASGPGASQGDGLTITQFISDDSLPTVIKKDDPMFGGAMTWSINVDANPSSVTKRTAQDQAPWDFEDKVGYLFTGKHPDKPAVANYNLTFDNWNYNTGSTESGIIFQAVTPWNITYAAPNTKSLVVGSGDGEVSAIEDAQGVQIIAVPTANKSAPFTCHLQNDPSQVTFDFTHDMHIMAYWTSTSDHSCEFVQDSQASNGNHTLTFDNWNYNTGSTQSGIIFQAVTPTNITYVAPNTKGQVVGKSANIAMQAIEGQPGVQIIAVPTANKSAPFTCHLQNDPGQVTFDFTHNMHLMAYWKSVSDNACEFVAQ